MLSKIRSRSASAFEADSFKFDNCRCPFAAFSLCFSILIKDAGVAGSLVIAGVEAGKYPARFACRYGDLPADPGLGVAGGGIKISERGSGDIDSASELS